MRDGLTEGRSFGQLVEVTLGALQPRLSHQVWEIKTLMACVSVKSID